MLIIEGLLVLFMAIELYKISKYIMDIKPKIKHFSGQRYASIEPD